LACKVDWRCNVAFVLSVAEEVDSAHGPLNYYEAILSADSKKWMSAMHEEIMSLEKNDTSDVCLSLKKKVAKCEWIFKRKEGMTRNEPARYKATFGAKGFSQVLGIDYVHQLPI
jgi:hypothetical protein